MTVLIAFAGVIWFVVSFVWTETERTLTKRKNEQNENEKRKAHHT